MQCTLVLIAMCCLTLTAQASEPYELGSAAKQYSWSPTKLLTELKAKSNDDSSICRVSIVKKSAEWLSPEEVISLFEFVDDDTPCLGIKSALSSYSEGKTSTVGIEARRMIDGYVKGRYPQPPVLPVPTVKDLRKAVLEKFTQDIDAKIDASHSRDSKVKPSEDRSKWIVILDFSEEDSDDEEESQQ